jgi:hypothetical protein
MLRFQLRTLVFLTAIGPPLLAGAWYGGRMAVTEYQLRNSEWIDWGPPGPIVLLEVRMGCEFGEIDAGEQLGERT